MFQTTDGVAAVFGADVFEPRNRNRCPHNRRTTAFCHAWPILLFVLVVVLYPVPTTPISSAVCERGFSAMNAQQSPTRNRLLTKNLDGILFVSVNGMPLNCWDSKPYVRTWLKSSRHSGDD